MNNNLINRAVFPEIAAHLSKKEITVLIGARQTGKTTLLNQLKNWLVEKEGVSPTQIISFNLDLISQLHNIRNQADFIRYLDEELKKTKSLFVFIDEVQRLENPGLFLKGIYDLDQPIKFIVTGSSTLEIKSKIFESLTGRKRVFHLWPLSFCEYLSWHEPALIDLTGEKHVSSINKGKLLNYFYDFSVFGGYPGLLPNKTKEEKIQTLDEIYSSYVEKDIINFMKINNPFAFTKLLALLADQTGALLNVKEISNTLGINIRTTENYLHILENTFVISLVRPYFTNARKELTKMPKVYFIDNGLRNMAVKYFSYFKDNRDKGALFETFAFSQLTKHWRGEIKFWRTKDKSEVDFVLHDFEGNLIPVEAKATEINKPSVPRGLRSFIKKYKPAQTYVVNLSLESEIKIADTLMRYILPYRLQHLP